MDSGELREALPQPRRLSTRQYKTSMWRWVPGLVSRWTSPLDVITRLEVNSMWIYITVAGDTSFLCHRRKMLVDVDVSRRSISIVTNEVEVIYSAAFLSKKALRELHNLL